MNEQEYGKGFPMAQKRIPHSSTTPPMEDREYFLPEEAQTAIADRAGTEPGEAAENAHLFVQSLVEYIRLRARACQNEKSVIAAYTYQEQQHEVHSAYVALARDLFREKLAEVFSAPQRDYALGDILILRLFELDFGSKLTYGVLAAVTALLETKKKHPEIMPQIDKMNIDFVTGEVTFFCEEGKITTTEYNEEPRAEEKRDLPSPNTDDLDAGQASVSQIWAAAAAALSRAQDDFTTFSEQRRRTAEVRRPASEMVAAARQVAAERMANLLTNWEEAIYQLCQIFETPTSLAAADVEDLEETIDNIIAEYDLRVSGKGPHLTWPQLHGTPWTRNVQDAEDPLQAVKAIRDRMAESATAALMEGDELAFNQLVALMMKRCTEKVGKIISILEQRPEALNDSWRTRQWRELGGIPDTLRG